MTLAVDVNSFTSFCSTLVCRVLDEGAESVEISRMSSISVARELSRLLGADEVGEAARPRDGDVQAIARKEELRALGACPAAEEVVIVKNTTGASRPWNLSTVPT